MPKYQARVAGDRWAGARVVLAFKEFPLYLNDFELLAKKRAPTGPEGFGSELSKFQADRLDEEKKILARIRAGERIRGGGVEVAAVEVAAVADMAAVGDMAEAADVAAVADMAAVVCMAVTAGIGTVAGTAAVLVAGGLVAGTGGAQVPAGYGHLSVGFGFATGNQHPT